MMLSRVGVVADSVFKRRDGMIWRICAAGDVPFTAKKVFSSSSFRLKDLKWCRISMSPCHPEAIERTASWGFSSRNWSVLLVLFDTVVMLPRIFVMLLKSVVMKGCDTDWIQSWGFGGVSFSSSSSNCSPRIISDHSLSFSSWGDFSVGMLLGFVVALVKRIAFD